MFRIPLTIVDSSNVFVVCVFDCSIYHGAICCVYNLSSSSYTGMINNESIVVGVLCLFHSSILLYHLNICLIPFFPLIYSTGTSIVSFGNFEIGL